MADGQAAVPPLPGFDINAMSKALEGTNLAPLAGMLNPANLGQLTGMLNNVNLGPLTGMLNNVNIAQLLPLVPSLLRMVGGGSGIGSLFNPNPGTRYNPGYYGGGLPAASYPGAVAPAFVVPPHLQADPRFVVLGAIKPFLPPDKGIIIDQVMKFLVLFLTISPLLPKAPIRPPAPAPVTEPAPATSPLPVSVVPAKV